MPSTEAGPLPGDLIGRRAVVTGAAAGIGRAITLHLARAGAHVVAIDADKKQLDEHFVDNEHITPLPSTLWTEPEPELLADLVNDLDRDRSRPIDLIVNNVGISKPKTFLELNGPSVREVIEVNLVGPLLFTRGLVEALVEQRRKDQAAGRSPRTGSVLFLSSLHDMVPVKRPAYSISKAGIAMAVRELAYELAPMGVRVNALSPGWVRTDPDPDSPRQQRKLAKMAPIIPLGRPGHPDDVAKLALVLLSDAWSGYVTGANLRVDGGLELRSWGASEGD